MSVSLSTRQAAALAVVALGVAGPALAQVQSAPPPTHYTLDARGVDLISGAFNHSATEVVIGNPGQGGLSYSRWWGSGGWRSSLMGTVAVSGTSYIVSLGGFSDQFLSNGTVYVPSIDRGQTLTKSGSVFTYTSADGTVMTFEPTTGNYFNGQPVQNGGVIRTMTYPSGEVVTFTYTSAEVVIPAEPPLIPHPRGRRGTRLQSVSNNLGYQLKLGYALNEPMVPEDIDGFLTLTKVTGFNMTVDACAPAASGCTFSRTWPSVTYAGSNNVTDELGRTTVYTASAAGGLTGIRYPSSSSGNDISIAYASGRVSAVTVGADTWDYAYVDAAGVRTTTVTDPLDHTQVVTASLSTGRATRFRDGLNRTTTFQWDSQGRPTRTALPEGNATQWTYGVRGNVVQVTEQAKPGSGLADITTSADFPAACANPRTCNQPTATTDPRGHVTDYAYDPTHGGVLSVTEPAPSVGAARPQTRFAYEQRSAWYKDPAGTLIQAPSPVWLPTRVSACATGETCEGTAREIVTATAYTAPGVAGNLLPVAMTSGDGTGDLAVTTTMTWTAAGDVETVDGPLPGAGDTTHYRYDAARQLVGVVGPDPDGAGPLKHRAIRTSYNLDGQATLAEQGTVADPTNVAWGAFVSLQQVATAYDDIARPVRTTVGAGGQAHAQQQVAYDAAHRVQCLAVRMDPGVFGAPPASACTPSAAVGVFGPDRITRNAYDAADQLTGVTSAWGLPEAITETASYSADGLPLTLTDGNGNVSVMAYDGFDRLARLEYPNAAGGGTSTTDYESWTYDPAGNLLSARDRAGQVVAFTYDALNRPDTLYAPAGTASISYAYDNLGRPVSTTSDGRTVTTVYDALSRPVAEITSEFGSVLSAYDPAGRRTRLTWPDGAYVDYGWDVYDGLTTVTSSLGGPLAGYAYDDLGQRTSVSRPNGVETAYGYDPVSRLASISHDLPGTGPDLVLGYSHNPAGQIVERTVSNDAWLYDPPTQVTDYANNGKNQLTGINGAPLTYDAAANLATGDGATYGYDGLNRLTTADPAGASTATLQYDPLGRLMRTIDGANTRFFYDGLQAIGEVDATGTLLRRYVPGASLDETAVGWDGAVAWPLTDERGSVIGQTYADGTVSINRYDEYGVPGAGNVGRFQYTGQMWLPEAGLYHYKARAYAPGIGRLLQTDPIGYAAGANLYAYVGGDPVNWTDPLGLDRVFQDDEECRAAGGTPTDRIHEPTGYRICETDGPPGGPGLTFSGDGPTGPGGGGANGERTDCPTNRQIERSPFVQASLRRAWALSEPRNRNSSARPEAGFWAYLYNDGGISVDSVYQRYPGYAPPSWPRQDANISFMIWYHTHPIGGRDGGSRFPSTADSAYVRNMRDMQGWNFAIGVYGEGGNLEYTSCQ